MYKWMSLLQFVFGMLDPELLEFNTNFILACVCNECTQASIDKELSHVQGFATSRRNYCFLCNRGMSKLHMTVVFKRTKRKVMKRITYMYG